MHLILSIHWIRGDARCSQSSTGSGSHVDWDVKKDLAAVVLLLRDIILRSGIQEPRDDCCFVSILPLAWAITNRFGSQKRQGYAGIPMGLMMVFQVIFRIRKIPVALIGRGYGHEWPTWSLGIEVLGISRAAICFGPLFPGTRSGCEDFSCSSAR